MWGSWRGVSGLERVGVSAGGEVVVLSRLEAWWWWVNGMATIRVERMAKMKTMLDDNIV